MALLAFGINHKTAPLSVREQLAFSPEATPSALQNLLQSPAVNEAVILSTCNRTELYSDAANIEPVLDWLAEHHCLPTQNLAPYSYSYHGQEAVQHLMRVATGLDSMVVGEPQILGQLKQAFQMAQQSGSTGKYLERLFPAVFAITKRVRTDTAIGANPVSIAFAAVKLSKQIFANLNKCTALLIGAGDTIELVATHLHAVGIKQLLIANRSVSKACQLAEQFNGQGIGLADLAIYLQHAHIVIAATNSPLPILGKGMIESALKARKHRPILMVDLAVPRNIEPEAGNLEDVYLYNIDDLQTIIADNLTRRTTAAQQAESLIEIQAAHLMRQLQALNANDTIAAYRDKIQRLCAEELVKAKTALQIGKNTDIVLESLLHNVMQKIMHAPSVQLRQAAYDGQLEFLLLARRLFEI